ncbi:ATP-binding protein [Thalassotalea fusca]
MESHTLMEAVATTLALVIGVMATIHYFSHKKRPFLYIGAGFIGAFFLDGYHAIVTSAWFDGVFPSVPESLIPWSWNASRTFLAVYLFLSCKYILKNTNISLKTDKEFEWHVVRYVTTLTLASFLVFAFVPLPAAYYPDLIIGRPSEFVAAIFFMLALKGYFSHSNWRTDSFDFCVLISLFLGVVGQICFMAFSFQLFDAMFDMAHVLKIVSYMCVLIGLLTSMQRLFGEAIKNAESLTLLNQNLEQIVQQRTQEIQQENEKAVILAELAECAKAKAEQVSQNLRDTNSDLEQFVYVASHDLKAPLRAIDNLAEWIEEDLGELLTGEPKENMQLLRGRVARLEVLLDDLLAYSRTGKGSENVSDVHVQEVIDNVAEILGDNDENVHISTVGYMPSLLTQKAALELVFRNLINNAIKHHDRDEINIKVSAQDLGEFYRFSVIDDGPGIPPEFHEDIFLLFKTLKPRDEVEGSGMGLAIIKKLVSAQGGSIYVDSQPDMRGTTIVFDWKKELKEMAIEKR